MNTQASSLDEAGLRRSFRALQMSRALRSVGISFSTLALPLYLSQLGYSPVVIGLSFFAMTLVTVVLLLAYGFLGDRKGYRYVLLLAEGLFALSTAVIASVSNIYILLAAAAIGGFGGQGGGGLRGGFGPGSTALVGRLYSDQGERVKMVGRLTSIGGFTSIAGTGLLALHSVLERSVGPIEAFRVLYLVAFGFSLVSFLSLTFITEPSVKKRRGVLTRESGIFVSKVSLANFVNGLGIGLAIPLLPLWFKLHFGFTPTQVSIVYTSAALVGALASFNSHKLSSVGNRVLVGSLTRVLNGALLVAMALPGSGTVAAALYAARSFGAGVGAPTRSAITLGGVGSDEFGAATSITGVANRVAFGSSSIGGYLLTVSQDLPLEIGGAIQLGAGAIYYLLLRPPKVNTIVEERGNPEPVRDASERP